MNIEAELLLHPRILKHCGQLFSDHHYKHAASEAMTQVELALKEKSGINSKLYGVNLCKSLLGTGRGIKLRVPFGEEMQKQAEELFKAAFSYYRNYTVHDGSHVDEAICVRVMALASELLDLVGASAVSFADIGGVNGLVTYGVFRDNESVRRLLALLSSNPIIDDCVDGIIEQMVSMGLSQDNVQAVVDVGLVEYAERPYVPSMIDDSLHETPPDRIGWFTLTALGEHVLAGSR